MRRAILVMMALPDENTHRRYQLQSMWIGVPDDPQTAYAYGARSTWGATSR